MTNGSRIRWTVAVATAVLLSCTTPASGEGTQVATHGDAEVWEHPPGEMPDTIWSWWIHPLAARDGDATLVGSVGTDVVKVWRHEPDRTLEALWPRVEDRDDDHNAPAIATHPDRDTLVFYTGHNQAGPYVRYRTLSDTMEVGAEQLLEFPYDRVTYAQTMTDGDTVVLLTRSSPCRWFQRTSHDWGATWGDPVLVVEGTCGQGQTYLTSAPAPSSGEGRYRIAVYGHPSRDQWRHVDLGLLRLSDGKITRAGHESVGNLYTGSGLPIRQHDLATVWSPSHDDDRVRLLDLGESDLGDPMITISTWDTGDVVGTGQYRTVRYDRDRARWIVSDTLPATGDTFLEDVERERGYVGGASMADTGDVLLSREVDGGWLYERYRIRESRKGWGLVDRETFDGPVVRPYPVRGSDGVALHRLITYPGMDADGLLR